MIYLVNIIKIIYILSIIFINLKLCDCITVPKSPCPEIFWYDSVNNEIVGKIIITDFRININNSVIIRVPLNRFNKIRKLSLSKSLKDAREDIENGSPLFYKVEFQSQNVIPEVIKIETNGRTICKNQKKFLSGRIDYRHHVKFGSRVKYKAKTSPEPLKTGNNFPTPLFSQTEICGKRELSVKLMLNGEVAVPGTWPWLTAIFKKSTNKFICGGSLISHTTILTAAHCFEVEQPDPNDYMVGIGVHELDNKNKYGSIYSNVTKIFIHSDYDHNPRATRSYSDIALVILTSYVNYDNKIRPICLWKFVLDKNEVLNRKGYVAGWGLSDPNSGKLNTNIPSYVETEIVSNLDCLTSNGIFSQIYSNKTFCAGLRNGNGPCLGDSGNGLVMELENRIYIRGLVSQSLHHNKKICDLEHYVIYTDVGKFVSWIKRRMTP